MLKYQQYICNKARTNKEVSICFVLFYYQIIQSFLSFRKSMVRKCYSLSQINLRHQKELPIGTASANSVQSDLECTSEDLLDIVTLTLHNVTLTSQKPCQHKNKCNCSETSNGYTIGCLHVHVCGDNPRALASGLSYVQVDKHGITILYRLHSMYTFHMTR